MPGMPYQLPPNSTQQAPQSGGFTLLRVAGACLALVSILLALVGLILHQNNLSLALAALVVLFGLRVFLLWVGAARPAPDRFAPARQQIWQNETLRPGAPTQQVQNGIRQPLPVPQYAMQQILSNQTTHVPPVYEENHYQYGGPSAIPFSSPTQQVLAPTPAPAYNMPPTFGRYQDSSLSQQAAQPAGVFFPSYIPIDQDPIFALDHPQFCERCFMLPKEGEPLVECQDRYALNGEQRCYAVADGVGGSFVSGPWARMLAQGFVEHGGIFGEKEDFFYWLETCGQEWLRWMQQRWAPTMNTLRMLNGDSPGDWSEDISQGAQSTLIGCTFLRSVEPNGQQSMHAHVFAVGDGEFLLFRPNPSGGWGLVIGFPFLNPNEFDSRPDTLVSLPRADLIERSWQQHKTIRVPVFPNDVVVLATDALAKWLLQQVQLNTGACNRLLALADVSAFEAFIRHAVPHGQIDDDDLTMLILPISSMLR